MRVLDQLIGLLAPHRCLGCGHAGTVLCRDCQAHYMSAPPSRCYRCHAQTEAWRVCSKCRRTTPLQRVIIAVEYDELTKRLLHVYKFERTIAASLPIAELMSATSFEEFDVIIPVTTAPARIRTRGYDHTLLVARAIAKTHHKLLIPALRRSTNSRQVGATKAQRIAQAAKTYSLHPARRSTLKGRNVMVVDDMVTTGATLEAVARLLKDAGARSVSAIVLTQKQ